MEIGTNSGKAVAQGIFWKLLERFGVQGVQFVLQLILARILDAEHYGALSMMVIFTSLANVFIQNGFNSALIQKKDSDDTDFSSVLWVSLGIASVMYCILFFAAPWIAEIYRMPYIVAPFRVLCLMLFPGALNSIQLAKIRKRLDFKLVFKSNVLGILVSGTAGVVLAFMGAGLWALVAQSLLNVVTVCIVMWFTTKWRPRFVCSLARVKTLFAFGWKLLVSGLLDTLYQDIRSLVIGIKYDSGTLGYYNRGKQFPQFIINAINSAVNSVLLPAMSAEQDDKAKVKALMRYSVMLSSYIIFPMMAGLAAVATPLVQLLLTDKWLPCVPYLQIYCFSLAFTPVHTSNLQAINAMGRSDVFLKLEIIKKSLGIATLAVAVFCFDSPVAIALTGALTAIIGCFINAAPNKKLIDYSYFDQMKDVLPSFFAAIAMCAAVLLVGQIDMNPLVLLLIQIILGVLIYIAVSAVFRIKPFIILLNELKRLRKGDNSTK